ncbi:MAG: nitrilase-related carbon-nitrogen hydrolase [Planctomycetota bacterium]
MRVAALQFDVRRGASAANLSVVEQGLRAAARAGVELVVLPEMWASGFPGPQSDLDALVAGDGRSWQRVAELARELELAVAGSAFGAAPGALPRNRARLLERGACLLEHDKVHLFSPTAETESFSAGDAPLGAVEMRGARVGLAICYDLRFPELTRSAFLAGVEVLCVSAQWPLARAAHWSALVQGLAVANQCFVVACNRTGTDVIGRRELVLEFPGNSRIVSPHGELLAAGRPEDALVAAELDLSLVRELRRRVPVERDRRPELYARWSRDQRAP